MAMLLRKGLTGCRRKPALLWSCYSQRQREIPVAFTQVRATPRPLHVARTSCAAQGPAVSAAASPADAVETTAKQLQEELFRVLCEPRPSSPSLMTLARGMVAAGAQPSWPAVQALIDHFSEGRDTKSLKALLSLLEGPTPPLAAGADGPPSVDDPISILFSELIGAHCRRRDLASALSEVAGMEATGREAGASVFLDLLKACAIARPPLLREAEDVWAAIEERGLTTKGGVQQDLFIGRMSIYANSAGYSPVDDIQEVQEEALLDKVDRAWEDMLQALEASSGSQADSTSEPVGLVTAGSWIARASALALCARDAGRESDAAVSRRVSSLEAFRSYRACGGVFGSSKDLFAVAEIVRGLARCGRQSEVAVILADFRQAAAQAEEDAAAISGSGATKSVVDEAEARAAAARAASFPEQLLRALGARGRGLEPGGRQYGLALLDVVDSVAAEALAHVEPSLGGVDSRLVATLQALLTTSRFLDRGDSAIISNAANVALDRAAAAAVAAESAAENERHPAEAPGGGSGDGLRQRWPGPNLAALSLLAVLHVSQKRWEGIPAAIDVLQEMHDRGMSPPPSVAAQLETVFKRHGTLRQKRRASFLLARALNGFGHPPDPDVDDDNDIDDSADAGRESSGGGGRIEAREGEKHHGEGDGRRAAGLGDAIRGMVETSTTRGVAEWYAQQPGPEAAPAVAAGEVAIGDDLGAKDSSAAKSASGGVSPLSAEESYQLLRRRLQGPSAGPPRSVGARGVERACDVAAGPEGAMQEGEGRTGEGPHGERAPEVASSGSEQEASHRDVLQRVVVLAEKGRAHAALAELQAVDGRKRGMRVTVPFKAYALLFRALSNGYSARGKEELELAAAPMEALQWLLRGMARQGYPANTTILNFGLEAFAVAAKTRKVREGEEEDRARVGTEAMDFMEGMRDGWNGLLPSVSPNLVSFNIIIKVMCRLQMFDQAFEALEVMERGGFTPDRFTYSTLIHGLARAGDNDGAWEVMVEMTNKGIMPNSIVIDGIVEGFLRSGDVGEAISFSQHSFNQYACAPTANKYCRVVHAAAALDDGQHEARRAIVVAEQMWEGEWRGEGRTDHPVLGHATLRGLLEERGAFDEVNHL
ncbi:unnamed protein product [Scytosiphon promiscuus]